MWICQQDVCRFSEPHNSARSRAFATTRIVPVRRSIASSFCGSPFAHTRQQPGKPTCECFPPASSSSSYSIDALSFHHQDHSFVVIRTGTTRGMPARAPELTISPSLIWCARATRQYLESIRMTNNSWSDLAPFFITSALLCRRRPPAQRFVDEQKKITVERP